MSFKVGDVVIVVQSLRGLEGIEGTVVRFLEPREGRIEPEKNISVKLNGIDSGSVSGCYRYAQWQLRLKRPPSNYDGNQAGDWELCPFNPYKKRETA
jgi:hypothetical protein